MNVDGPQALQGDLEEILARNAGDFAELRNTRLFVTGGTGFVGSWLLESFVWANRRMALNAKAVVLTRDPNAFARNAPHLADDDAVELVRGDVRELPKIEGSFDAMVHAATPADAKINDEQPFVMVDTVVDGTRRVLELASRSGRIPVLFTSSGAIYGRQPPEVGLVDETYRGGPDSLDPRNAYHESKRMAELTCAIAAATYGLSVRIARLFAFVGPYLPIDRHFAIGNFISDALRGRPIEVSGDGTPVRTYLYAADMTSWLWRMLVKGASSRGYNVGSERTVSIGETAQLVAAGAGQPGAFIIRTAPVAAKPIERYACSANRARTELGLAEWTTLEDGIRRTLAWHRARGSTLG